MAPVPVPGDAAEGLVDAADAELASEEIGALAAGADPGGVGWPGVALLPPEPHAPAVRATRVEVKTIRWIRARTMTTLLVAMAEATE
jgi:hypothetical protein